MPGFVGSFYKPKTYRTGHNVGMGRAQAALVILKGISYILKRAQTIGPAMSLTVTVKSECYLMAERNICNSM